MLNNQSGYQDLDLRLWARQRIRNHRRARRQRWATLVVISGTLGVAAALLWALLWRPIL